MTLPWTTPLGPEEMDEDALARAVPWSSLMRDSGQDPVHHGEGDVWTHTMMVARELVSAPAWRDVPDRDRDVLFAAALLHDVGKPRTRRVEEGGRITNRGHSAVGSRMAREFLWSLGVERGFRERVCALVAAHQVPFNTVSRAGHALEASILETALCLPPRLVAVHARADAKGRVSPDIDRILAEADLYEAEAEALGVGEGGDPFPNPHARVRWFGSPETFHRLECPPDRTEDGFVVTVMSGLPGSGKSRMAARLSREGAGPVLSMDALRDRMGVRADQDQGRVVQAALEELRSHLRRRASLVWDSTGLTRDTRGRILDLAHAYGARTRVVAVERGMEETLAANRARPDRTRVPEDAFWRMVGKWQPPTLSECHVLEVVEDRPAPVRARVRAVHPPAAAAPSP